MCGIAGYISENFNSEELLNSIRTLSHRGPDNISVWNDKNTGLAHARLSILDLSISANQPMTSKSGRYVMVYNGEVYNFKELKAKYKIQTKTTSDSEVILELFEQKGAGFVNELNGMFAIAIYDKQNDKLFLFRDRLGIKPLFYFFDKENFCFASEIKALLKFEYINKCKGLKDNVIYDFLHLGYIPEPNTFFKNIYKFPSGSFAEYSGKALKINKYWNIDEKITENTIDSFSKAKEQLSYLIEDSVKKRMISDVPLGTFLSGGIDSSLVSAIAQKYSNTSINTFSIGFKENKFNESEYAKKVAKHIGSNHTEFIVSHKDVAEQIDNFFNIYDEPFADSSGLPVILVSQLAKQQVSVVLSGDGGDELFHGYGMYLWAKRLNKPLVNVFKNQIKFLLKFGASRYKRVSHLFDFKQNEDIASHIFSQEQYFFSGKELDVLLNHNQNSSKFSIDCKRKLSVVEKQSIFDIKNYLKDDLLVKVDRASMLSALEVRVPLLDHRIVEYAINLNEKLKINNKEQKFILKQILFDYLPKEFFDRPKWGFSIPLESWLKNELIYLLEKYTSKEIINKYNIVNYKLVLNLKNRYLNGQTYLYNRLWLIVVLHKYLEKYF